MVSFAYYIYGTFRVNTMTLITTKNQRHVDLKTKAMSNISQDNTLNKVMFIKIAFILIIHFLKKECTRKKIWLVLEYILNKKDLISSVGIVLLYYKLQMFSLVIFIYLKQLLAMREKAIQQNKILMNYFVLHCSTYVGSCLKIHDYLNHCQK